MKNVVNKILFSLLILSVSIWLAVFQRLDNRFAIIFLDVGQGDAIYIKTTDNKDILIDAGPGKKVLSELSGAMAVGDKTIDLVIATHNDMDHIGGMDDVLAQYEVKEIWLNGAVHTTQTFLSFLEAVKTEQSEGAEVKAVMRGYSKEIGEAMLTVLAPFESLEGVRPEKQNEASIVARIEYNDFSALFTGDIDNVIEEKLIASQDTLALKSKVLKVPHHGSRFSSSENFIKAVSPETAVISVGGNNSYGHPAKEVLERLSNLNIEVLRTDQLGKVKLFAD